MKLLKINEDQETELDGMFDEVENTNIERAAPEVVDNSMDVSINGWSVDEFDAVYAVIPQENAIFGRVLLEMIEEQGPRINYSSTAFFIMAKKNYLYHVLHEKNVPAPKTVVAADEKSARNINDHLKGPLVAKKFNELKEVESTKIDTVEGINEFAEGVDYGDSLLMFSELREGKKYKCLVAGDEVISLADDSDSWRIESDYLKYSSISTELEEIVKDTVKALGTNVAEVMLQSGKVVDVNPNPDLETYTQVSGKNAYKAVAKVLKEDN